MGGADIQFTEGTTQSPNLIMSFYATATVQIQQLLRISISDAKQVWLADDATSAGSLTSLKKWWTNIIIEGGRFGYCVSDKKSWLILKNEALLKTATNLLSDSKFNRERKRKERKEAYRCSNWQ